MNPQQTPTPRRRVSRLLTALVTVLATLAALVLVAPPAMAATSFGHQGPAYSGVANPPTSDKPQSKLWFNDGSWWATMWTTGKGWDIWRLDRGTESWVDTGVTTDTRSTALTDTLWDGTHLYVAAQYATVSTISAPVLGKTGNPAKLYRYTYANGTYSLDTGFPVSINNISSESLTIDEDSTGRIWASWVQITGTTLGPSRHRVLQRVGRRRHGVGHPDAGSRLGASVRRRHLRDDRVQGQDRRDVQRRDERERLLRGAHRTPRSPRPPGASSPRAAARTRPTTT